MLSLLGLLGIALFGLAMTAVLGGASLASAIIQPMHRLFQRIAPALLVVTLGFAAWATANQRATPWTPFTEARFDAVYKRHVVVVACTADWCLSTGVLISELERHPLASRLGARGVRAFKIDFTDKNPEGERFLAGINRISIPCCAIFGRDGKLLLLSDSFRPEDVGRAIDAGLAQR
jgi:thiol:disulfide interchange protein